MSTETKNPQGWKDITITPDLPLSMSLNFLNALNQRLCRIEDVIVDDKGKSLTEFYREEAEAQAKEVAEKEKEENK